MRILVSGRKLWSHFSSIPLKKPPCPLPDSGTQCLGKSMVSVTSPRSAQPHTSRPGSNDLSSGDLPLPWLFLNCYYVLCLDQCSSSTENRGCYLNRLSSPSGAEPVAWAQKSTCGSPWNRLSSASPSGASEIKELGTVQQLCNPRSALQERLPTLFMFQFIISSYKSASVRPVITEPNYLCFHFETEVQ